MDKEKSFKQLVKEMRQAHAVEEALQLGGDLPQCEPSTANDSDWQHALMLSLTDLFEQCRFDESDPVVNRAMRRQLAKITATCEAWDEQLLG